MNALVRAARRYLGAPYIWKGKGDVLWSMRGMVPHAFGVPVFDCSGFVGQVAMECGAPDRRGTHSAQTYFDELPVAADPTAPGVLRLYGSSDRHITHVAICVGGAAVIEAAGGDSRTTAPTPNACVREGPERRSDFRGARTLTGVRL